jgi:hypothetical protein
VCIEEAKLTLKMKTTKKNSPCTRQFNNRKSGDSWGISSDSYLKSKKGKKTTKKYISASVQSRGTSVRCLEFSSLSYIVLWGDEYKLAWSNNLWYSLAALRKITEATANDLRTKRTQAIIAITPLLFFFSSLSSIRWYVQRVVS